MERLLAQASTERRDGRSLSEHVREGHPPLLGATARGGKGPWSLLLVLVGCAAPPPPAPKPVAPIVTATAAKAGWATACANAGGRRDLELV